jgi:hypothetical protein
MTGKTRQGNGLWIAPTVKADRQAIRVWLGTKKYFAAEVMIIPS